MIKRRAFLALAAAATLSACATAPLMGPDAGNVVVQDVQVSTGNLKRVTGRVISKSNAQVQSDVRRALASRIQGRGAAGGKPVRVLVDVENVNLVSPGMSLLVGGVSTVTGSVSVVDASTGSTIVSDKKVNGTGTGWAPGGVAGAVSRGTPEEDYRRTVAGFANVVAQRLLGEDAGSVVNPTYAANSGTTSRNEARPTAWKY